jgi:hypothetical protein
MNSTASPRQALLALVAATLSCAGYILYEEHQWKLFVEQEGCMPVESKSNEAPAGMQAFECGSMIYYR